MYSVASKRELARVIGLEAGGTIFRVEINLRRIYLG